MAKLNLPGLFAAGMLVLLSAQPAYCDPSLEASSGQESITFDARRRLFGSIKPTVQIMAQANKLVQVRPSWDSFYRRAYLRFMANQYAAAVADCEQSLKLQKSQAAYYLLAGAHLFEGPQAWPKALAASLDMAKANPEASYPYEFTTFIAALMGDFDQSMDQLATVAAPAGRSYHPGSDLCLTGQLGHDALEKITASLSQSGKQKTQKQLVLALSAHFMGEYARSQAILSAIGQAGDGQKQSRISPGDLALALSICNDQMLGQTKDLEEKALKLVHQTGESKAALSLLDTTYFSLGQRDKSLAFFNHLIDREAARAGNSKTQAKMIELLYARAVIHEQMRDARPALEDCLSILKLDPGQRKARLEVCRYKLMLEERQGARTELDKYIGKFPDDGAAHFLRAQIFVLDKNWQSAASDLSQDIQEGYYLLKALRARAACYRAMHQNNLAANDVDLAEKFRLDNILVRDMRLVSTH